MGFAFKIPPNTSLNPGMSFNRTEKFQVNLGPTFKYPPPVGYESVSQGRLDPVKNVKFGMRESEFSEFDLVDDCMEESLLDCERYFAGTSGPGGSNNHNPALTRRVSSGLSGPLNASTNPTATTTTQLPVYFPSVCTLTGPHLSLNQSREELKNCTDMQLVVQALKATRSTMVALLARMGLVALFESGQMQDVGKVEDVCALCKLSPSLLPLLKSQEVLDRALFHKLVGELALLSSREYSTIPWLPTTTTATSDFSPILVHNIWSTIVDEMPVLNSVNEVATNRNPSFAFALGATKRLKRYRNELIKVWQLVLRSPGARIKIIASQVLIELLTSPDDGQFPTIKAGKRIKRLACELMARSGTSNLHSVPSRFTCAMFELAAVASGEEEN
jgi:hypothetical protein